MMRSESPSNDSVDYKQKYRALKKKLHLLVYEQECFVEELRKSQRKLLRVTRDRSFLLDRLLQYEHVDASSSDSDSTASSDSINEPTKDSASAVKKKRPSTGHPSTVLPAGMSASTVQHATAPGSSADFAGNLSGRTPKEPPKKKPKVARKVSVKTGAAKTGFIAVSAVSSNSPVKGMLASSSGLANLPHQSGCLLSREEIERHLDLKHSNKPQFLSIDMMPHSLPDDIFCHDNSNPDCPSQTVKIENEDTDLVIDMA